MPARESRPRGLPAQVHTDLSHGQRHGRRQGHDDQPLAVKFGAGRD